MTLDSSKFKDDIKNDKTIFFIIKVIRAKLSSYTHLYFSINTNISFSKSQFKIDTVRKTF